MKILLVEDNEITANALTAVLTTHYYTVETAADEGAKSTVFSDQ